MTTWQPIETAPKDGTNILLFVPEYQQKIWLGSYYVSETFNHGKSVSRYERWNIGTINLFGKDPQPTHWMPLPEPPTIE